MPKNMNLEPVKLPMTLKFGEPAKTEFKDLEKNIKVELIDGPTTEQLLQWVPQFALATWNETANEKKYDEHEAKKALVLALSRKTLPTVLENMRFTFKISGMTYVEVSHILRQRQASFSAYCSGDVQLHDTNVMIPESIKNSKEFRERYERLMRECKELYADMVNSKKISLMDARYALPVSREQAYFMSMPINVLFNFINQRIDEAIQPCTDNLMAFQMWLEVVKRIPLLAKTKVINLESPSWFFIKQARTGHSTNLYFPSETNDKFEWHPEDFIYQCKREDLCGTDGIPSEYGKLKKDILDQVKAIENSPLPEFDDIIEEVFSIK